VQVSGNTCLFPDLTLHQVLQQLLRGQQLSQCQRESFVRYHYLHSTYSRPGLGLFLLGQLGQNHFTEQEYQDLCRFVDSLHSLKVSSMFTQ
jgi:hypothetical protein